MTAVNPCRLDDCDRLSNSGGLCYTHARRLRRTGTTDAPPSRPAQELCTIPGCDRIHKSKGYCKGHYMEIWRATKSGKGHPAQVPMPRNAHEAAGQGLEDAASMICDVRDIDPTEVWETISGWSPTRAAAAIITLAAMVPDDRTTAELLAWTTERAVAPVLRSVS